MPHHRKPTNMARSIWPHPTVHSMLHVRNQIMAVLTLSILLITACDSPPKNEFWHGGEAFFEVQEVFTGQRFPNIVTAVDGTIVATWGNRQFLVRRSEDGGNTWGPVITVADPGFHGGGVTVDEQTGAIWAFVEEGHPPSPLHVYRSLDHGLSWQTVQVSIHPDSNGHIPSMHMNERGLTLRYGTHAGRLIRPSRSYGGGNARQFWAEHYTNAIYSDDGGLTWHTSEPFPIYGTGEATIEELHDGTLYYNTRRHLSTDGLNPRMRYSALSTDGGHTWEEVSLSEVLPDGPQDTDYGLMAGLVRLPVEGHDILLFSNVESEGGRHSGTVWVSFDGGKTWPVKRLAEPGGFAYSSMTAGRAGTASEGLVYLMYEGGGNPYGYAYVARFNLDWVTGGQDWRDFLP